MPKAQSADAGDPTPAIGGSESIWLRPMDELDVASVASIESKVAPDGWTSALFAGEFGLAADARHWLVAIDGAEIVGFGGLMIAVDEAHVLNVATDPGHQRRGVARHLLTALMHDAADRGVGAMTLEVRASNEPALSLYRELGFVIAGTRPNYYADGEDAVIMWLHDLFAWQRGCIETMKETM